jgi:hypothetical protein
MSIHIKAFMQLEKNHPDSLVRNCITRGREFPFLSLYLDQEGRMYRAREELTEQDNGQKTDPYQSERIICFDVYIPAVAKTKKISDDEYFTVVKKKVKREEKSQPPSVGDELKLKLKTMRDSDKITIREFNCMVEEVSWGRFVRTTEERDEIREMDSLGFVQVRVNEQFGRSLIIDTDYNLKRFKYPIAA